MIVMRKNNILYRRHKSKWGWNLLIYVDFKRMTVRIGSKSESIYLSNNILRSKSKGILSQIVQEQYHEWIKEEIDYILLGK